jgi:AraC family transcriptional regulator
VEQARTLLRHSARSLSDVALACGFSHQSHVSTIFRRATGRTPSAYRAQWHRVGEDR